MLDRLQIPRSLGSCRKFVYYLPTLSIAATCFHRQDRFVFLFIFYVYSFADQYLQLSQGFRLVSLLAFIREENSLDGHFYSNGNYHIVSVNAQYSLTRFLTVAKLRKFETECLLLAGWRQELHNTRHSSSKQLKLHRTKMKAFCKRKFPFSEREHLDLKRCLTLGEWPGRPPGLSSRRIPQQPHSAIKDGQP